MCCKVKFLNFQFFPASHFESKEITKISAESKEMTEISAESDYLFDNYCLIRLYSRTTRMRHNDRNIFKSFDYQDVGSSLEHIYRVKTQQIALMEKNKMPYTEKD